MYDALTSAAGTFAAVFVALFIAHHLGDHAFQPGGCAVRKGERSWAGIRALMTHCGIYTAITTVAVLAIWPALGLAIHPAGLALGVVFNFASHAAIDMRWTLRAVVGFTGRWGHLPGWRGRLARALDNTEFYNLGTPRELYTHALDKHGNPLFDAAGQPLVVKLDQPILTTGSNRLDQDAHYTALGGVALAAAGVPAISWAPALVIAAALLAGLAVLVAVATAPAHQAPAAEHDQAAAAAGGDRQ